jgi:UDP-glucuronate 4-epimerase
MTGTRPSRILVSGCAGFIGAKVSQTLLNLGYSVLGLDNLNDAYDLRVKKWRLDQFQSHPSFDLRTADISDRLAVQKALDETLRGAAVSAVINLAARAGVRYSVENPWVYYETNVTGTLNLLELARTRGIPKFVLASSSSLYGRESILPYREDRNTDFPLSPYAASKKAAETLCYTYHHLHGLDVTVFRYFTVYGPAGRPDMMPFRLAQWITEGQPVTVYGDGTQSRDFTYVDDIVRGTIAGLRPLGYEVLNLGSDRPVVLLDLIHMVEKEANKKAMLRFLPPHPADVTATWADISKARRLLDWTPQTDLQTGVAALMAWYRQERGWAKDVATR